MTKKLKQVSWTQSLKCPKCKHKDVYSKFFVSGFDLDYLECPKCKHATLYEKRGYKAFLPKKPKLPKPVKNKKLEKQYRQWQKEHPNFMTPYINRVYASKRKVIELSEGTGFHHEPLYGVTTLKKDNSGFQTLGGKPFFSKHEALTYFNELKRRKRMIH